MTVAWEGPYDGAPAGMPYAAVNVTSVDAAGTTAAPPQRLADPGDEPLGDAGVRLGVDQRGDAAVVWDTTPSASNDTPQIVVARRLGQDPFESAQLLGTADDASLFDAAIGPTGALAVAWQSHYRINASLAPGPTAPLRRPGIVSPPREGAAAPVAAISATGQTRIAWQSLGPSHPPPGAAQAPSLWLLTSRRS